MIEHDRTGIGLRKAWSLGYYIPRSGLQDRFSEEILRFKSGQQDSLELFSKLSTYHLLQLPIMFDGIIRPLGSSELVADGNKPLDYLGKFLSAHLVTHSGDFAQYLPHLIRKNKITSPLHLTKSRNERVQLLTGVYESNNLNYELKYPYKGFSTISPKILIVDDVITTGTTISEIARVLNEDFFSPVIYGFTLASTTNQQELATEANCKFEDIYFRKEKRLEINNFLISYQQGFISNL